MKKNKNLVDSLLRKGAYIEIKTYKNMLFAKVVNIQHNDVYPEFINISLKILAPELARDDRVVTWDLEYLINRLNRVIERQSEKNFIKYLYD